MSAVKSAVEALADEWQRNAWLIPDRPGGGVLSMTYQDAARRLADCIAADKAAGRLVTPVMDGPSFGDYWPTDDELKARAEKAERERDEWKARAEMWEAGAVRYKESRDAADDARRLAYARGRDEALAEVEERIHDMTAGAGDRYRAWGLRIVRYLREGAES